MLFPGGVVMDRAQAIDSMREAPPWVSYELSDERVLQLTPDCCVVVYSALARREDDDYAALFTSTYVRVGGDWKLALHQQTPA